MRYEHILPIPRQEAERIFQEGDVEESVYALLRLTLYDSDWQWVQSRCIEFLKGSNHDLQAIAITCIGHLARIHHTIDLDKVAPLFEEISSDPELQGRISDAMDDIAMFVEK
jgi:hypothetical protein